jgi:nitrogen regulatory protein PII
MPMYSLRLVRIVAEKTLLSDVTSLLATLGARGYTYFDAAGFGEHGERTGTTPETANVVIEVLVSEHDAERILHRVEAAFLPRHALIAYVLDARTLRREKFL